MAKPKVGVTVTGEVEPLKELTDELRRLARLSAEVGYLDPVAVPDSNLTVPELAAIQEFGTKDIPSRPFMRRAAAEAKQELDTVAARVVEQVVDGELGPVRAMDQIADAVAQHVLRQLDTTKAWADPNDPDTIEAKGGDTPLYAGHGTLREGLRYAVVDQGTRILTEKPRG